MKKNLLSVVLLLSSTALLAEDKKVTNVADLSGDLNIGYITLPDVMQTSKEGKKLSQEIEGKRLEMTQELQKLEQDLMQAVNEFKTKAATLSDSAREKAQKDLAKKEREYKGRLEECEMELKLVMQKISDSMLKEVEQAVGTIAQNNKLDAVVDATTGRVMYVAPKANYTADLIKEMDKTHDLKLAKAKTTAPKTITT